MRFAPCINWSECLVSKKDGGQACRKWLLTWKPKLSCHLISTPYKLEVWIHRCRSNFGSRVHCMKGKHWLFMSIKILMAIYKLSLLSFHNMLFSSKGSHRCNMDLPASSPSVRNFRYVGMKSFLNVWPIEVYFCIFLGTRIITCLLPECPSLWKQH